MLPLIVVSNDQLAATDYWKKLAQREQYKPYYIFIFEPEKKEFSIDQVRNLKKQLITANKEKQLFVLSFDSATGEAQNALLKTLEEKQVNNQFILLVSNADVVLPTIRSRAKIVNITSPKKELRSELYQFFDDVLKSSDYGFLSSPLILAITPEKATELLDAAMVYVRKLLPSAKNAPAVLKKALELKRLLQSNNLNAQLTIDTFLIYTFKKLK